MQHSDRRPIKAFAYTMFSTGKRRRKPSKYGRKKRNPLLKEHTQLEYGRCRSKY